MPARASPAGLWIGMMSGTSIDAVDGALVTFRQGRGGLHTELLEFASEPIDGALRDELLALQAPGPDELERAARAANALTLVYASVAGRLLRAAGDAAAVRAIGAHGQTVRHCPDAGFTIQLINGALLAARCGRPVVVDFRSADVAAGGQGAPLAPAFHRAAFGHRSRSRVVVNIGGIANVSLITPGVEPVVGFDTGPGNVLLDAWCQRHLGQRFDRDGAWAASGRVDRELLARMLAEPYFGRMPPKSTGRDLFNLDWLLRHDVAQRAAADVQATLLELTAATIAAGCSDFGADDVYVCGGGACNARLLERLAALLAPQRVATSHALGMDPQAVEAVAFAWLARERCANRAASVPAVTGAASARVLGAVYAAE
ncbi:MAG TPA: anhydro-N-acetylmuramic acid kinase [Burkholderiaceae bacterium]|nr:anhydro-N-acetylmuramic acid kinase [Burkholderiaceae bacterium]